jgi:hypothetical protein
MLRQILKTTILLLLTTVTAAAQQTDIGYGQSSALRGITRVFVQTEMDIEERSKLVNILIKQLPGIEMTETPEAADVLITYRTEIVKVPGTLTWINDVVPIRDGYDCVRTTVVASQAVPVVVGMGEVLKTVGPGHVRLLMSFRTQTLPGIFERSPSTRFALAFVNAYKRANPPRTVGK